MYLGSDRWGDWFGQDAGWRSHRPGRDLLTEGPNVTLLPPSGDHAVTLYAAPPASTAVYIDLGWDVRWPDDGREGADPEGIDMDLDVVRTIDGRGTWVDDRDEWAEHRVAYGYPPHIVEHLEALALDLEQRVRAQEPPYDPATAEHWLGVLAALVAAPPPASA